MRTSPSGLSPRADISTPADVRLLIDRFYARVLNDPQLAPIFLHVAGVDLQAHLPRIYAYWEKLLLGIEGYRRHTMNIHRALHDMRPLQSEDFSRWLRLFHDNADQLFAGAVVERAKTVAARIAANMQIAFEKEAAK